VHLELEVSVLIAVGITLFGGAFLDVGEVQDLVIVLFSGGRYRGWRSWGAEVRRSHVPRVRSVRTQLVVIADMRRCRATGTVVAAALRNPV